MWIGFRTYSCVTVNQFGEQIQRQLFAVTKSFHRGYHEAWVQSEMKLSTNEWLGWCSKHFLNKYCLLIRINFVRWTTQHQQILSMKNQSSHPDFFRGLYSLNCQRFSTIVHYRFEIKSWIFCLGNGPEACSIEFFLHWSICMRYFGLPFLAISVQNQAEFECNSTTPNNRNTLSNCINLTAAAILSSKQISQPKAVFFTNNTGTLSMIAQILKVIVLKETLY